MVGTEIIYTKYFITHLKLFSRKNSPVFWNYLRKFSSPFRLFLALAQLRQVNHVFEACCVDLTN